MITVREAAKQLGITTNAVRDRMKRGTIRHSVDLVTGLWQVDEEDLERKAPGRPRKHEKKPHQRPGRPRKSTANTTQKDNA